MGCCACPFERDPNTIGQKPISLRLAEQLSTQSSSQRTDLQITLKGESKITEITGPLGDYNVVIGEETRGEVVVRRAKHVRTAQPCVVTEVKKNKRRGGQKVKGLLLNTLMEMDHSHIVRTYEVCEDASNLYIVTEDYSETLQERLRHISFYPDSVAAHLFSGVLSALSYCHQRGFAHRRIDCHSLVFKVGQVELSLTGLENAELLLDEGAEQIFAAPETKRGEFSDKSDIWSCGIVLSALLLGLDCLHSLASGSNLPHLISESLNELASDLVLSMLRRKPESRPTATECLAHAFFQSGSLPATPHRSECQASNLLRLSDTKQRTLREAVKRFIVFRVLSNNELWRKAADFDSLDVNRDGVVSLAELEKGLKLIMSDEEASAHASRILASADRNLNRVIDYSEYILSSIPDSVLTSDSHLSLAFRSLDLNSNGKLSISELKSCFAINVSSQSDAQWRSIIAEADSSGDGEIDFDEFCSLMKAASTKE